MKPLAVLIFLVIFCETRAQNATEHELLNTWITAVTRVNDTRYSQKYIQDDFGRLIDVLSILKSPRDHWNFFWKVKTAILRNGYQKVIGQKAGVFTNFCGPGDAAGSDRETVCGIFNGIDECCKAHDSCEHIIISKGDYDQYPNLPKKNLYFTSLSCDCDVEFYNCMKATGSVFADIMLAIYSVAQSSCFQQHHLIEKCTKFDE